MCIDGVGCKSPAPFFSLFFILFVDNGNQIEEATHMTTNQVQVGQHVSGKSTGCTVTGFPSGKSIYGTVVSVRECLDQTLVDVNMHGTIIPCRIETIEIHGQ